MRKLLASLLVIVLVFPLTLATLSVISVSAWALDRSFYEDLLGDTRLYEVMLSEDLPNYFNRQLAREIDSDLPAAALGKALREVVTPEYMRDQALRIVDDTFDAIEGRDPTLDLTLDLKPLKAALAGEGGRRFARTLAAELPTCAAGQEPLTTTAQGTKIISCRPSNVSVDEAANLIALALPSFVDKVPDHISLNRNPVNLRGEMRGVPFWLVGAGGLSLAMAVMVVFSGSVWLAAALIGGYDKRERLLWLGWSLIVPAVLVFLIGLAVNSVFATGWVRFGLNEARLEGVEYSESFRLAMLDVSRTALNTIANGFLATGAVSGAIALALIAWGWGTPPEPRMAPAMATVAAPLAPQPPAQNPPSIGSTGTNA